MQHEIKSLKPIHDNFFEYKNNRWILINLYTEVVCKSNSKIEKALLKLTKEYKNNNSKIFEIRNKMQREIEYLY